MSADMHAHDAVVARIRWQNSFLVALQSNPRPSDGLRTSLEQSNLMSLLWELWYLRRNPWGGPVRPDAPELLPALRFIDEINNDAQLLARLPVLNLNSEDELQRGRDVAAARRAEQLNLLTPVFAGATDHRTRTNQQARLPATTDMELRHVVTGALMRHLMRTDVPPSVRALPVRLVGESLVPLMDHLGYLVVMDPDATPDGHWLLVDQALVVGGSAYGHTLYTVGDLLDWADDHL